MVKVLNKIKDNYRGKLLLAVIRLLQYLILLVMAQACSQGIMLEVVFSQEETKHHLCPTKIKEDSLPCSRMLLITILLPKQIETKELVDSHHSLILILI